MRLRAERSNLLKPIVKDTSGGSDEIVLKNRVIQYRIIYKFVESFFRWEHNFQRSLKSLVIRDETKTKKSLYEKAGSNARVQLRDDEIGLNMKLALEFLADAKRVLMRDGDQYVIMNFAMIEDD